MLEVFEGLALIGFAAVLAVVLFVKARTSNYQWPKSTMVMNLLVLLMIACGTFGVAIELAELSTVGS